MWLGKFCQNWILQYVLKKQTANPDKRLIILYNELHHTDSRSLFNN